MSYLNKRVVIWKVATPHEDFSVTPWLYLPGVGILEIRSRGSN